MSLDKEKLDALDSWFNDEEEGDQDPLAVDYFADEENTSDSESVEEEAPNQEISEEGAEAPEPESSQAPVEEADPHAWIEQLDPEMRKHVEALVHSEKSNRGRVAAFQSRLDAITAERDALRSNPSQAPQEPAVQGGEVPEESVDPDLQSFRDDFPTVASAMDRIIADTVAKEREAIMAEVAPLQQQVAQERIMQERGKLRAAFDELFNSADSDEKLVMEDVVGGTEWMEWLSAQPPNYQQYVRQASSAVDATKVLQDFAYHIDRTAPAAPPEAAPTAPPSGNAAQVAKRREEALAGSTPPSRSGTLADGGSGSYEDAFDYFASKQGS